MATVVFRLWYACLEDIDVLVQNTKQILLKTDEEGATADFDGDSS